MSFINAKIIRKNADSRDYHKHHGDRGKSEFIMSPSSLHLFAQCPARWVRGYKPKDTPAKDWGNGLDCLLLTPEQFSDRYAIQPATYRDKDGQEKDWRNDKRISAVRDWLEHHAAQEIIKADLLEEWKAAATRVMSDDILATFVAESDKQMHVRGEWQDAKTGLTVPVECLIDLVPRPGSEFEHCLGDLKTTRNASGGAWSRWSSQTWAHVQAAFDIALYNAATGDDRDRWCFVLVENFPPFQTGRRMLSTAKLDRGWEITQAAMEWYCQCLATKRWDDYDDLPDEFVVQGWQIDDLQRWERLQAVPEVLYRSATPESEEDSAQDDVPV